MQNFDRHMLLTFGQVAAKPVDRLVHGTHAAAAQAAYKYVSIAQNVPDSHWLHPRSIGRSKLGCGSGRQSAAGDLRHQSGQTRRRLVIRNTGWPDSLRSHYGGADALREVDRHIVVKRSQCVSRQFGFNGTI